MDYYLGDMAKDMPAQDGRSRGCVCMLCVALGFFALPNVVWGCFVLVGFFWAVFSTVKSWKTYKDNCNRDRTDVMRSDG